ncbi:hypothetical protein ACFX2J_018552 [Malus domestica]
MVIGKLREHHKKKAKDSKKLGLKNKKVKKDLGIPNDWSFKEQELKALEAANPTRLQIKSIEPHRPIATVHLHRRILSNQARTRSKRFKSSTFQRRRREAEWQKSLIWRTTLSQTYVDENDEEKEEGGGGA